MKLISRFNYDQCPRQEINGERVYVTPDDQRLPSVTTILGSTQSEEKMKALAEWRAEIGSFMADKITSEASSRGTRMHKYIEQRILTETFPKKGSNPLSWASHSMAQLIIEQGMSKVSEVWGCECPLYYPSIYAGTTDCVGVHEESPSIIDFKQSNREKSREDIEDYFLQLVFYGTAHNKLHQTNISKGVIMMAVKPATDTRGIPTGNPSYLEFILEGKEWQKYEEKMWNRIELFYTKRSLSA